MTAALDLLIVLVVLAAMWVGNLAAAHIREESGRVAAAMAWGLMVAVFVLGFSLT